MKTRQKVFRTLGYLLFAGYCLALVYFMFFSDFYGRTQIAEEYHYNLRPFKEIGRFIRHWEKIGGFRVFLNLGGNIIGFIPMGIFLPALFKKCRKAWIAILYGFEMSLFIECLQLLFKVGSFDVDDIILNTLGVCLGYVVFHTGKKFRRQEKWEK